MENGFIRQKNGILLVLIPMMLEKKNKKQMQSLQNIIKNDQDKFNIHDRVFDYKLG